MGCAFAVSVCGEQGKFPTTPTGGTGGTGTDGNAPVVTIILPAPPHDTIQDITDGLKFTVADTDNVKLKSVQVTVTGIAPYTFSFIDSAAPTGTGYTKTYTVPLKRGGAGKHVVIAASALDPSGNLGIPAKSDTILIVDQKPPVLTLSSPAGSSTIGAGTTVKVISSASDTSGVRYMGARLFTLNQLNQRVVLVADSNIYAAAPSSKTDTIQLKVPATVAPGSYQLQSFARDSSPTPNDTVSASASIQVITVLPPFGSWVFPPQDTLVVAGDSFIAAFDAKDSAGVKSLAFAAYSVKGDSSLGTFTTTTRYSAIGATLAAPLPKDTTIRRYFKPTTDSTVDSVFLAATVTNIGGRDTTIRRRIQVIKGPFVMVTRPTSGSRVPTGPVNDTVGISGYSPNGIQKLGFIATGVAAAGDSVSFASPYVNTQTAVRFLNTPVTTPLGVDTIVPFAVNGLGARFTGKPILVSFADTVSPAVTVQLPAKAPQLTVAVGDSVFVQTHVTDNRGVASLVLTGVALRGSVLLGTDTVVTRYTPRTVTLPQSPDTVITRYLRAATPVDSTGEYVYIIATATDSSGNKRADTTQIRVVSGPRVTILSPSDSSVTSPNKIITVSVHAKGTLGVHVLGWRASGVVNKNDSTIASPVNGALPDTLTFTSNLTIPSGTPVGSISITGFATDTLGNPSAAVPPRTVLVLSTATSDVTPPTISFSVPLRVEVGDSITVTATDPGGIRRIGFIVHHLGASDTIQLARWADTLPGNNTNVIAKFRLNLDTLAIGTTARQVTVEAFAYDSVLNRGVTARDTLTVVAGTTIGLPQGGAFGDAIVDAAHGGGTDPLLLLTNTLLDQVEVFHLSSKTFGSPIRVGSQPVGIALWPKDTLGTYFDSVIVANSGGTNLSLVDVRNGVELSPRRAVPNWSLGTMKTENNGQDTVVTLYELGDRPQYLAATCRKGGVTACDSVLVVYSTAPSPAQPAPFTDRGYVAWENISAPLQTHGAGHLFWEQAPRGTATDTLQIIAVRDVAPGVAIRDTIVGFGAGIIIDLSKIAFQDSTFVRNSGNFVHALLGEGGLNQGFARAMMYDETKSISTLVGTGCNPAAFICQAQVDAGVSAASYVSDFLVNHASPVRSIATNFNGRTNLVRADSIYAFDWTLKQTGLLDVPSGNAGMDFDPKNDFDAATRTSASGTSKNDRLVFGARPDAGIDVFDTYWYQRVGTVPIRDTIIGPIRVAKSGSTLILAGVTSRGLVVISLPSLTNPFPVSPLLPLRSVTEGAPVIRAFGRKAALPQ